MDTPNTVNAFNAWGELSDMLRPLELLRCSRMDIEEAARVYSRKSHMGITAARNAIDERLKSVISAEARDQ